MTILIDDMTAVLKRHFGAAPDDALADLELAIQSFFSDPAVVHQALLRGSIGKPDLRTMLHAYGELRRWDDSFKPAYVYYFETIQETGKHTGCGVIHATNKKDALNEVQSVVSMTFPEAYGAKVVVNDIGSEPFNIAILDGHEVTAEDVASF